METNLIKENARLRKDLAPYQNALAAMELRAKHAEAALKMTRKRLSKVVEAVLAVAGEPALEESAS
jgi:hypothetical protein